MAKFISLAKLIGLAILIVFIVSFALHNTHATEVHFVILDSISVSTIALVLICTLFGAVGMYLFLLVRHVKKSRQARKLGSISGKYDEEF